MVMLTSSRRVRSSCLRSLPVVDGTSQTACRSSPRARIVARSAAVRVAGRAAWRRASSASAAGDQPVVGVDGLVTALGLDGLVAGLLDLAAPLLQDSVVTLLELAGGLQA